MLTIFDNLSSIPAAIFFIVLSWFPNLYQFKAKNRLWNTMFTIRHFLPICCPCLVRLTTTEFLEPHPWWKRFMSLRDKASSSGPGPFFRGPPTRSHCRFSKTQHKFSKAFPVGMLSQQPRLCICPFSVKSERTVHVKQADGSLAHSRDGGRQRLGGGGGTPGGWGVATTRGDVAPLRLYFFPANFLFLVPGAGTSPGPLREALVEVPWVPHSRHEAGTHHLHVQGLRRPGASRTNPLCAR